MTVVHSLHFSFFYKVVGKWIHFLTYSMFFQSMDIFLLPLGNLFENLSVVLDFIQSLGEAW